MTFNYNERSAWTPERETAAEMNAFSQMRTPVKDKLFRLNNPMKGPEEIITVVMGINLPTVCSVNTKYK